MSKRVIGYVLIAVAIVGLVAAFGSVDLIGSRPFGETRTTYHNPFEIYGFLGGLSRAYTFGGLPLSTVATVLVAIGLVGAGLLIFGGKAKEPPVS